MGALCSTEKSIAVRGATEKGERAEPSLERKAPSGRIFKTRPAALDGSNAETKVTGVSGSSGADDLIALDVTEAPGIERFEGDVVESQVDGFGGATSITAPPAVLLQSVQSVSEWFHTLSGAPNGELPVNSAVVSLQEHDLVSPSADVDDEIRNDNALADAERLAPVTHYDATSAEDRQQQMSRRVVDPLKFVTPKLPPAKKCTFFSF